MNLYKESNQEELGLFKEVGIEIDDRDYTNEELRQCQNQVIEYIMSHSKNEISNVKSKFESVLKKINV